MANPIKRGESGSQVSSWNPSSSSVAQTSSTLAPYGLKLQQTITETKRTENIVSISGSGVFVTVYCVNSFAVGQTVTISGVTPDVYNITGVVASLQSFATGFCNAITIASTATGTYVSGGTITSGSLALPPVPFVYAIIAGAGGGGGFSSGGAGAVVWGWTRASNGCIVGVPGTGFGGYTRYGHLIAGGGGSGGNPGSQGSAGGANGNGSANYYAIPGGSAGNASSNGGVGSGAGGGWAASNNGGLAGNGISGGGGGSATGGGSQTNTGANGGNGLAGGGGGAAYNNTGLRLPGDGGTGFNFATNAPSTGGKGWAGVSGSFGVGGGGGGIGGNGIDGRFGGTGGLGGGGGGGTLNGISFGGAGLIYLYW